VPIGLLARLHGLKGGCPHLRASWVLTIIAPSDGRCAQGQANPCDKGYYNPTANSANPSSCERCPEHSFTGSSNTTQLDDCLCDSGYYRVSLQPNEQNTSHGFCKPCPVGTDCSGRGSTLQALPLMKGYYRINDATEDVRICQDDAHANCSTTFGTSECESTSACQGGVGDPCADNLMGPYCRLCNRSDVAVRVYYQHATSSAVAACVECKDRVMMTVLVVSGVLLAATLMVLLAVYVWHYVSQSKKWMARLVYLNAQFSPADKLKIMFGFYQIATQVPRVNDVPMPTHPNTVLLIERLSVVVSLGLQNVATTPLECVGLAGYLPRLLFWMIAPVVVTILVTLLVLLWSSWKSFISLRLQRLSKSVANKIHRKKCRRSSFFRKPAAKPTGMDARADSRADSAEIHGFEIEGKTTLLVHDALPVVLFSLFVFYPTVTLVAFEGFSCYEFRMSDAPQALERHYLRSDVSIDCDSYEYDQVRILAWVAIIICASAGLDASNSGLLPHTQPPGLHAC
jgi:hypothetical protein